MGTELGRLDGWLERLYARIGWKLVIAYQAFSWGAGAILVLVLCAQLARLERLASTEVLAFLGISLATVALAFATATWLVLREVHPFTAWVRNGRPSEGAADAWRAALLLPRTSARWNTAFAGCLVAPVGLMTAELMMQLGLGAIIASVFAALGTVAAAGAGGIVTGQLVARPLIRDVEGRLGAELPLPRPLSVRPKLLVLIPSMLVCTGGAGVALSIQPGQDVGDFVPELGVTIALVLLLTGPLAVLLAYSSIQPLDDLIRATVRLKSGDYSSRVPVLSNDEFGTLARSFNEAMDGLAERARLSTENERLLEEALASRARIVTASDAERRRVERNLHDGAQQRLVALALQLRVLEEKLDDPEARKLATAAMKELRRAIDELRDLARGLHPQVLTAGGLAPALEQLAGQASVPVSVSVPHDRYREEVESTAYFVASEALANVAKYSQARSAEVSAKRLDGRLVLEIRDDGVGGAAAEPGSGLAGLADRVAALDGELTLESPPGAGTTVTVRLPIEPAGHR